MVLVILLQIFIIKSNQLLLQELSDLSKQPSVTAYLADRFFTRHHGFSDNLQTIYVIIDNAAGHRSAIHRAVPSELSDKNKSLKYN